MEAPAFLWMSLLVVGVALSSRRLREAVLTAPMVVVAIGGLYGLLRPVPPGEEGGAPGLRLLFELTLALVVFSAAARAGLARRPVPTVAILRLAFVALPLTVGLGTLLGRTLWPHHASGSALLLATLSAATDGEVARPFFDGRRTPPWASRLLEAEGGLTDGLLLTALWVAVKVAGGHGPDGAAQWASFLTHAVVLAVVVGWLVGWAGGLLLEEGTHRGLFEPGLRQLAALSLAVLAWTIAARLGASGLTSAFCAGLAVARSSPRVARDVLVFVGEEGLLLLLVAFAVAGALLVPFAVREATWRGALWAALSLTVLRMAPVWLALAGAGYTDRERTALGWMGPRGIPTIALALVWREEAPGPLEREMLGAVSMLVLASIVLHGLTARATGRWLARTADAGVARRAVRT